MKKTVLIIMFAGLLSVSCKQSPKDENVGSDNSSSAATSSELPENGSIETPIGKLTFESGYPSKETVQKLYDDMDFQRACQAYLWGIPAVGMHE